MKVINLWGAPSSGKSTTAAGLFFLMKINKWRVELVTEYAKDLVWENQETILQGEQTYIFGEQNHRLARLNGQIDYAITDSPLPLTVFYMPKGYIPSFPNVVMEQFHDYDNINILLKRTGTFEKHGRRHDESQSERIADELEQFLNHHKIQYQTLEANPLTPQAILKQLTESPEIITRFPFQTELFQK